MRQATIDIDDNVIFFQSEPFPAVIRGTVEKIGMDITVGYLEYLTRPAGEKETSLQVPPASLLVITELPYSSVSGNIGAEYSD